MQLAMCSPNESLFSVSDYYIRERPTFRDSIYLLGRETTRDKYRLCDSIGHSAMPRMSSSREFGRPVWKINRSPRVS